MEPFFDLNPNVSSSDVRSVRFLLDQDEERSKIQSNKIEEDVFKDWKSEDKKMFLIHSFCEITIFLILLYIFLISLNFMTIGFTLITPYALKANRIINLFISNPLAALSLGIILTAIVQNGTITTSMVVTMVGAGILPSVKSAIPIIIGSNIGTCVTNSFIALTLSRDPKEFKRAFTASTLNDMFNFLTTLVLLPCEIFFNSLSSTSERLTSLIPHEDSEKMKNLNFIGKFLNPVTDLFIRLNPQAIDLIKKGSNLTEIALKYCDRRTNLVPIESDNLNKSIILCVNKTELIECSYLCMPLVKNFGDEKTGVILIVTSLFILLFCIFGIVKVLSLLIDGPIAAGIRKAINASFSGKMKRFTGIALFFVSFLLTLIVQSANIVTATLVPLCAMGMVSLQRVYFMMLGSNVGTTFTGLLSAFTQPPSALQKSLQLAFVYTLFNLFGVLMWLPFPFMRFPMFLANKLGNIIYEYSWFLYVYVATFYFVTPSVIIGLTVFSSPITLVTSLIVMLVIVKLLVILVILQSYTNILPKNLKNFEWLKTRRSFVGIESEYDFPHIIRRLSSIDITEIH